MDEQERLFPEGSEGEPQDAETGAVEVNLPPAEVPAELEADLMAGLEVEAEMVAEGIDADDLVEDVESVAESVSGHEFDEIPPCHYCENDAVAECPTCGRYFCDDHGDDVCLRCMAPESAAPSAVVYKGALVALVVGTVVALYLLVSPPASKSKVDTARPVDAGSQGKATATPTRQGAQPSPTATRPADQASPSASASASASASPAGSATAGATTPTAPAQRTYTVKSGDTLSGIASANGTTVVAIMAANPGLTENLQIGQVIKLP